MKGGTVMTGYNGKSTSDISIEELTRGKKAMEWLWNALMKVNNQYDKEEFEDVFEEETLGDLISEWELDAFISKFKEHEIEREKICIGDEIRWTETRYVYSKGRTVHVRLAGIVLSVEPDSYVVLACIDDYVGFYKRRLAKNDPCIEKTYVHFDLDKGKYC